MLRWESCGNTVQTPWSLYGSSFVCGSWVINVPIEGACAEIGLNDGKDSDGKNDGVVGWDGMGPNYTFCIYALFWS